MARDRVKLWLQRVTTRPDLWVVPTGIALQFPPVTLRQATFVREVSVEGRVSNGRGVYLPKCKRERAAKERPDKPRGTPGAAVGSTERVALAGTETVI